MMAVRRPHRASPLPTARVVKIPRGIAPMRKAAPASSRGEFVSGVGSRIRSLREVSGESGGRFAQAAGISRSMLSRIERGLISPSMVTLERIAQALGVSVPVFFSDSASQRSICHVPDGSALAVEERFTPDGHRYEILGQATSGHLSVESSMVRLEPYSELPPFSACDGVMFVYMLEGTARFRYGSKELALAQGDSMLFDAAALHGMAALEQGPVRFLTTLFNTRA